MNGVNFKFKAKTAKFQGEIWLLDGSKLDFELKFSQLS